MKSIEFAYWLQGYFETCDVESINRSQISTIQNHLEMVEIVEGKEQLPFCFWLRGLFDGVETADLSLNQTTLVKERLNILFEHVIKPQAGFDNFNDHLSSSSKKMNLYPDSDSNYRC